MNAKNMERGSANQQRESASAGGFRPKAQERIPAQKKARAQLCSGARIYMYLAEQGWEIHH